SYPAQQLLSDEVSGAGGFHLVSRQDAGLTEISSLDIPASRVRVKENIAYLAAGKRGLVVVDISNVTAPEVIARLSNIGHVYDIDISGHMLYAAVGGKGIAVIDITVPSAPQYVSMLDAFNDMSSRHVVALSASVVSGGWNSAYGAIQVIPDSELKLFHADPVSGILDYDADGKVRAIFRFSKAIDLYAPNEQRFHVTDGQGQVLPFALDITGNQAEITLTDVSALTVGDRLVVTIDAGLSSVKPLTETNVISLYKLKKTQTQTFIYRGRTAADLWIDSVLPRRQTVGKALDVTMSVHGLPLDKARVRAWIGDQPISITSLESNDEEERVGILYGTSPALNIPGYYDVRVDINRYGIWETTRLLGAVAVDAPLTLNSVIPQWGPLAGGTRVEITGTGFEPGNTVADGIHPPIGSAPVTTSDVISSRKLIAYTPRGATGRQTVPMTNRYQQKAELPEETGFGYGLRPLAQATAALAH